MKYSDRSDKPENFHEKYDCIGRIVAFIVDNDPNHPLSWYKEYYGLECVAHIQANSRLNPKSWALSQFGGLKVSDFLD